MLLTDLTPVQRVVFKLVWGLPLDAKKKFTVQSPVPRPDGLKWASVQHTERSYVRHLHSEGRSNVTGWEAPVPHREVWLVTGRRSGKSLLTAALATEEMAGRVRTHRGQGPMTLCCALISHNKKSSVALLDETVRVMRESRVLGPRLANTTANFVRFQTDEDVERDGMWVGSQRQARASLQVAATSGWAKALRGRHLAFLAIDEADHMPADQAEETFLAGAPSVQGCRGTLVVVGTPGSTVRATFFRRQFEAKRGLGLRIPTWEMNPHITTEFLTDQYSKYPDIFWSEWGACFMEQHQRPVGVPRLVFDPGFRSVPGVESGSGVVFRSMTVDDLVAEMRQVVTGERDGHDRVVDAYRAQAREKMSEGSPFKKYVAEDILAGWVGEFGQAQPIPQGSSPSDRVGRAMNTLNDIGHAHQAWQDKNFDDISLVTQGLCLAEECGEVARAIVKAHHGVRVHDRGNLADELADVVLVATSLATRAGIDLDAAVASKAARRDLKDFRARPETG